MKYEVASLAIRDYKHLKTQSRKEQPLSYIELSHNEYNALRKMARTPMGGRSKKHGSYSDTGS